MASSAQSADVPQQAPVVDTNAPPGITWENDDVDDYDSEGYMTRLKKVPALKAVKPRGPNAIVMVDPNQAEPSPMEVDQTLLEPLDFESAPAENNFIPPTAAALQSSVAGSPFSLGSYRIPRRADTQSANPSPSVMTISPPKETKHLSYAKVTFKDSNLSSTGEHYHVVERLMIEARQFVETGYEEEYVVERVKGCFKEPELIAANVNGHFITTLDELHAHLRQLSEVDSDEFSDDLWTQLSKLKQDVNEAAMHFWLRLQSARIKVCKKHGFTTERCNAYAETPDAKKFMRKAFYAGLQANVLAKVVEQVASYRVTDIPQILPVIKSYEDAQSVRKGKSISFGIENTAPPIATEVNAVYSRNSFDKDRNVSRDRYYDNRRRYDDYDDRNRSRSPKRHSSPPRRNRHYSDRRDDYPHRQKDVAPICKERIHCKSENCPFGHPQGRLMFSNSENTIRNRNLRQQRREFRDNRDRRYDSRNDTRSRSRDRYANDRPPFDRREPDRPHGPPPNDNRPRDPMDERGKSRLEKEILTKEKVDNNAKADDCAEKPTPTPDLVENKAPLFLNETTVTHVHLEPTQNLSYAKLQCGGRLNTVLIDSGAGTSCIAADYYRSCFSNYKIQESPIRLSAASSTPLNALGVIKLPVQLKKHKLYCDFTVVENLTSPMILGWPTFKKWKGVLDSSSNTISFTLKELQL